VVGIGLYLLYYFIRYHKKAQVAKPVFWSTERGEWLLEEEPRSSRTGSQKIKELYAL
jgi:hypothetical protein